MERKYIMRLLARAKVINTDLTYKDGKIVITAQLEGWIPEDGDIIAFGDDSIGIVKHFDDGCRNEQYITLSGKQLAIGKDGWTTDNVRPATEEEKQQLFDAMAKEGKRWNAEKKIVEDVRWRAELGEVYYYIKGIEKSTAIVLSEIEDYSSISDWYFMGGNYFKTEQAARTVGNQIVELFKNSKPE